MVRSRTRVLGAVAAAGVLIAAVWILGLPTKSECIASGRILDPTVRHCVSQDGYVLLREHAGRYTVLAGAALIGAAVVISFIMRFVGRRSDWRA